MSVTAFDSANWQVIPSYAQAVLPYADGRYKWSNSHFPSAQWRYITIFGNPAVDILDIEPGCCWPPSAGINWAHQRQVQNEDITIYCNRDTYPSVAETFAKYEWHLILATLDGTILTEFDGKPLRGCQYTDHAGLYDMSMIYDDHWLYPAPKTGSAPFEYINIDVVKWGDPAPWNSTLWGIASHYGLSVDELEKANPGMHMPIQPGQIIKVPIN